MKKTTFTRLLSCILCIVLIAAMALIATSCSDDEKHEDLEKLPVSFTLKVKYADGKEDTFEIESSKTYLIDALLDEKLVEGEDQSAGFYIKTVNGVTADYNVDGTYWAFYIDGEYASTGADTTPIVEGAEYTLAVEG